MTTQQFFDKIQNRLLDTTGDDVFDDMQREPAGGTEDRPTERVADNESRDGPTQEDLTHATDEALYEWGIQHLQAGEWGAAVECLSALVERQPAEPYYASLLNEARLKANLDEHPPRRNVGRTVTRNRLVWALVIVTLILSLALLAQRLYTGQIIPALRQRATAQRQQQLLQQGTQLLVAGNLDEAEERFAEALALNPDDVAVRATLEEIQRRRNLVQSYNEAMALIDQEDWESALETLEAIRDEAPGFPNVQEQIARVQKLYHQAATFEQAEQLFRAGVWQAAVDQLLQLKRTAPDFKPEAVDVLLFKSYMNQAEATLLEVETHPTRAVEVMQAVIGFIDRALELDPSDAAATVQAELAREYLAGLEAYQARRWSTAIDHLTRVTDLAPDYASQRAAELLALALTQLSPKPQPRPQAEPTPAPQYYVVREHDTLSEIAKAFHTTVAQLVDSNPIVQDPDFILPSWELVIPAVDQAASDETSSE